jgi:uncharacterized phiE125 gp8 family phage protein
MRGRQRLPNQTQEENMSEEYPERLLIEHTAPAEEPLTLAESKLYLRVDGTEEDTLISAMIVATRHAAEQYLRRTLITRQWKLAFDDAAPVEARLPMGPVRSITQVNVVTESGVSSTVSSTLYRLNAARSKILFDQQICAFRVEIIYEAGFGTAVEVPSSLRQGMLAHLAELYDGRSVAAPLPDCAVALYHPYREVRL